MILKNNPDEIADFLKDASNSVGTADVVYLPESYKELREILRECFIKRIPVTVSGGKTGLVGGAVPNGGAVISLKGMNSILSIDETLQCAILEPGVLLKDFAAELLYRGYFYPPDPTESTATIGGTIATNASGARTYRYGATRHYVKALKIILADGDELYLRRGEVFADGHVLKILSLSGNTYEIIIPDIRMPDIKHAAGYFFKNGMDGIDLFIGSEGTLGVIAEIEVEFLKAPEQLIGGVVFFSKDEDVLPLLHFLKNTKNLELSPRLLEFFDERSIVLLKETFKNIPSAAGAALWFEQEATVENADGLLNSWADVIRQYSALADEAWIALHSHEHERIRQFRHALPSAVYERISSAGQRKVGTDMAVGDEQFPELFAFFKNEVARSGLDYVMFGHIGNNHLHVNMFAKNDADFLKAKVLYSVFIDKTLEFGGTISAEHGVGKLKTEFLKRMYDEKAISQMLHCKGVLDPEMLLGRGTVFGENF